MNFKDAEWLIKVSLIYHNLPLMIVGKNGIGKTTMIDHMVDAYKHAAFIPERLDFGGLSQASQQIKSLKINTLAIADMQVILSRKGGVRDATIGLLTSWISEGISGNNMGFNNVTLSNKKIKASPINIIDACTPIHFGQMVQYKYSDFLDRHMIINLEREIKDFNDEGFKLEISVKSKPDKDIYNRYIRKRIRIGSPRHTIYLKRMIAGLISIKVNPLNFIERNINSLSFFEVEGAYPIDINRWLKQLSPQEMEEMKKVIEYE